MNVKKIPVALLLSFLVPSLALAQLNNTTGLLFQVGYLVDTATVIVAAIALLAFFYGLTMLLWGDGEKIAEGKTYMIWGVVALFVMVSVWGLVRFIQHELLPSGDFSNIDIPAFNGNTFGGR